MDFKETFYNSLFLYNSNTRDPLISSISLKLFIYFEVSIGSNYKVVFNHLLNLFLNTTKSILKISPIIYTSLSYPMTAYLFDSQEKYTAISDDMGNAKLEFLKMGDYLLRINKSEWIFD